MPKFSSDVEKSFLAVRNDIAAMENRIIRWMMGGFIVCGAFLLAGMAFLK